MTDVSREKVLAGIRALADGRPHNASALAMASGIVVDDLPTLFTQMAAMGVVATHCDDICQLSQPLELLDVERIRAAMKCRGIVSLNVLGDVDSTNCVLRNKPPEPGHAVACLAEFQRAGRGRMRRPWVAPFASGLCFSVGWVFGREARHLAGLSLAVGVALRDALHGAGIDGIGLKWPNDLFMRGRKLGGILVELHGGVRKPCYVVTGVGLNLSLSDSARQAITEAGGHAIGLDEAGHGLNRNLLAALALDAVVDALKRYDESGLAQFLDAWREADILRDRSVTVSTGATSIDGIARGIDPIGAIVVEVDGEQRRFAGGEVSLRERQHASD